MGGETVEQWGAAETVDRVVYVQDEYCSSVAPRYVMYVVCNMYE